MIPTHFNRLGINLSVSPIWEKTGVWIMSGSYTVSSAWTISGFVDSGSEHQYNTYVWSRGVAHDFVRNGDGKLEIYNKGVVSGLLIQNPTVYCPIIYSGGTLYNVTANISSGAVRTLFECSAGGVVSHVRDTATHSANQNIGIYGSVYDVSLSRNMTLVVTSGGYLSGCSLMQNLPKLTIYSGGSVDNLWISAYTSQQITVSSGGVLNTVWASSADININGTASNIRFQDNTLRMNAGTAYAVSTFNAALNISSSYISGWTMLRLKNGGTAPNLQADTVEDYVFSVTVDNASYTMSMTGSTALIGGSMYDGIRATVANSNVYVEDLTIGRTADTKASAVLTFTKQSNGGPYMQASNVTLSSGGTMGFMGGQSASEIYVQGGYFWTGNSANIIVQDIVVASGSCQLNGSGNIAVNVIISSGGYLQVAAGAVAIDVTSNPGAIIDSKAGATMYYVGSPGPVYGFYGAFATSGGTILSSGMSMETVTANNIDVFNSGYIANVIGGNYNIIISVYSGGSIGCISKTMSNGKAVTILKDGGTVHSIGLSNIKWIANQLYGEGYGGSVTEITLRDNSSRLTVSGPISAGQIIQYTGGGAELLSGAICSQAIVSANHMYISSGATALAANVYADGHLSVFSGGTALGVVNNNGEVWSEGGAVVKYVE